MLAKPSYLKALSALLPASLLLAAQSSPAIPPAVTTQHNDNARTGANRLETKLTLSNVNSSTFGKLFTLNLDNSAQNQVLYVPNLTIKGKTHNVIFAYTSSNWGNGASSSVFAFDADLPGAYLWKHTLPNTGQWMTDTPVIDTTTNTLYVVTKDNNDSGPTRLRAINILDGTEKPGSPVVIRASVHGTGDGNSGGIVSFDSSHANCRSALLLLNGVVYCAFSHNTDSAPYHGWIFGYKYDGKQFTQTAAFCANPNGGDDGIWMAGQGLVADAKNYIYCTVGNGTFSAANKPTPGIDYGMCFLKLRPNLTVADWFAPFDELGSSNADLDTGNAGIVGIPGTTRLFSAGAKFGSAFLVDSNNLGGFTANGPDKVLHRFDNMNQDDQVGQNPVCWDTSTIKYVYLWAGGDNLQQFRYDPKVGKFTDIYKQTSNLTAGGALAVSSNGGNNGILWAVDYNNVVHAFDATDVTKTELWNSNQKASRDQLDSVAHWHFPTVVNGKLYVTTGSSKIVVYGLLPLLAGFRIGLPGVTGGQKDQAQVTLSTPTPNSASITLSSANTKAATVPSFVPISAGGQQQTFNIATYPVAADTTVNISASYGGVTKTVPVTVKAPVISAVQLSPSTVKGGSPVTLLVELSGVTAQDTLVKLTSSSAAAKLPASITVPSGNHSAHITFTTGKVTAQTLVTITAKLGTGSVNATLTLTP